MVLKNQRNSHFQIYPENIFSHLRKQLPKNIRGLSVKKQHKDTKKRLKDSNLKKKKQQLMLNMLIEFKAVKFWC